MDALQRFIDFDTWNKSSIDNTHLLMHRVHTWHCIYAKRYWERESKTAYKRERGREMMCCFNAYGDCESKSLVRKLLSVGREDWEHPFLNTKFSLSKCFFAQTRKSPSWNGTLLYEPNECDRYVIHLYGMSLLLLLLLISSSLSI